MIADELHIKTAFGPTAGDDIVKIMWPNVAKLVVNRPIPFSLKEGTTIVGTAQPGEPGTLNVQAAPMGTPMAIPLDAVVGMNQPAVIYTVRRLFANHWQQPPAKRQPARGVVGPQRIATPDHPGAIHLRRQ
ncbi:MAG: hypothetical protein MRJ92_11735 [Nitrospira sp.]|nr:hypothetical protein [Nitrospira sp.]